MKQPLSLSAQARRRLLGATLALTACGISAAHAQADYPNKPIRLIVPFANAGVTDTSARIVAEKLGQQLGQQIIVDNKPGAGGNIGTQMAAKADPDGYTLLLGYDGTLVINPNVYAKVPFDTVKDFTPIGKIGDAVLMIAANPKLGIKTVADLQHYARTVAGGMSYGSAGNGSTTHLAGEMFHQRTGIPMTHVPYKGGGQALLDVVGGNLPVTFAAVTGAMPFVKSGQVDAVAVTSRERAPSLPNVPTLIEAGMKDFEISSWVGLMAPARTPKPVIDKLSAALQKVLNDPAMRERLASLGIVATPGTPDAYGREIVRDLDKNKAIVKAAHIKLD
ncbi:Tripartite-type tricarboxylate transporter, receptor component TctC [Cupriavidus sp. OV038]|uniref:Bug family tripartite tricarboxylate transporter substrate binding protein n=1 Tax=unclassified Cupriavidus TaxID=2640874 RepID=UPI0008F2A4C3|nr:MULTISPECIES: tripartite tricarboxylate transporter substrate binding protein [unclassified Cupriavidus]SFB91484.1 Tripartite-type tricarboxylate transporter, receptor component TctC [Cupriavidus sp. OV038]SFO98861.1 Tripartite-type tricarboxylate transporter, receptor component TctC [Cupriavidus sp. OV096]